MKNPFKNQIKIVYRVVEGESNKERTIGSFETSGLHQHVLPKQGDLIEIEKDTNEYRVRRVVWHSGKDSMEFKKVVIYLEISMRYSDEYVRMRNLSEKHPELYRKTIFH